MVLYSRSSLGVISGLLVEYSSSCELRELCDSPSSNMSSAFQSSSLMEERCSSTVFRME